MLEQLYRQECLGFSNTTGRLKKQNQLLGRILLFIEENLNRSFTIEELCSAFHCSRSYISHLFCSSTGHSFPEYLNLLRMEEARKLLAQTDFPITEIALKTGFSSSSYFSSVTKYVPKPADTITKGKIIRTKDYCSPIHIFERIQP